MNEEKKIQGSSTGFFKRFSLKYGFKTVFFIWCSTGFIIRVSQQVSQWKILFQKKFLTIENSEHTDEKI